MTTRLGKILVFVNLGISLMMAAWAIALYTTRTNWSDKSPSGDPTVGELKLRLDRKTQLENLLGTAQARWKASAVELARVDGLRNANLVFYKKELEHLQGVPEGQGATDRNPARRVRLASGLLVLANPAEPLGPPAMENAVERGGAPLQSKKYYGDQYVALQNDIADQTKRFRDLVRRDADLTAELVGQRGDAGLRGRLRGESGKRDNLEKEFQDLRPVLGNVLVEGDLLLKRQRQLRARVAELEAVGVATGRK